MSIFFKYRERDDLMNSSFTLMSGPDLDELRLYHVGDNFHILFDLPRTDIEFFNRQKPDDIEPVWASFGDATIHIKCTVVSRSHACSFRKPRNLQVTSHSFTVEAISDSMQDLLEWFLFDERPVWMQLSE